MSGCEGGLEKVSSLDSIPEPIVFDYAPEEIEYKIKLNAWTGVPLQAFSYDLKKGKKLPYTVKLKGERSFNENRFRYYGTAFYVLFVEFFMFLSPVGLLGQFYIFLLVC